MHLVISNVHAVTACNSTIQSNYRTSRIPRYSCPNHHRSISIFPSWNQAFRILDFLGHSLNINLEWWKQWEGWLIWPYFIFLIIIYPGFMIITPSLLLFSIVFSNQWFSNCSSTTDVGFVQPLSHCFCGKRVFRINIEFCCHLCCSGHTIVKIQSSVMYSDPLHLVLVFGHSSS